MKNTIQVTNDHHSTPVTFNVRLVKKGELHNENRTHDDQKPIVMFFDSRYPDHGYYGQFVSSYYATTILESDTGINLQGGIENWYVTKENVETIKKWLTETI